MQRSGFFFSVWNWSQTNEQRAATEKNRCFSRVRSASVGPRFSMPNNPKIQYTDDGQDTPVAIISSVIKTRLETHSDGEPRIASQSDHFISDQ